MKIKNLLICFSLLLIVFSVSACTSNEKKHKVIFDSAGAAAVESQTVADGALLTDPGEPKKEGNYIFKGWHQGDKLWNFDTDTVKYEFTLTAKWVELFTVTFDSDGGTLVPAQTVEDNLFATEPKVPERSGFVFIGWFYGDEKWNFAKNMLTSNIVLKAKWTQAQTVTFNSDGGNDVESQTVGKDYFATEPAPPTKMNHEFLGWYYNDVLWNFKENKVVADITLIAKWKNTTTYTVTFNTGDGTPVSPQYIIHGGHVQEPPAPMLERHTFIEWTAGGMSWDFNSNTVTADTELTATWQKITNEDSEGILLPVHRLSYTVAFDTAGGDYLRPKNYVSNKTIVEVPNQVLPTPTRTGYTFGGWYLNGKPFNVQNHKMTADITLVARWGHTVKFNSGNAESLPQFIEHDSTIVQPATPIKEGAEFLGWYKGDVKWNFELDKVTSDITLTAKWSE